MPKQLGLNVNWQIVNFTSAKARAAIPPTTPFHVNWSTIVMNIAKAYQFVSSVAQILMPDGLIEKEVVLEKELQKASLKLRCGLRRSSKYDARTW